MGMGGLTNRCLRGHWGFLLLGTIVGLAARQAQIGLGIVGLAHGQVVLASLLVVMCPISFTLHIHHDSRLVMYLMRLANYCWRVMYEVRSDRPPS
jgi:hypothetical protein